MQFMLGRARRRSGSGAGGLSSNDNFGLSTFRIFCCMKRNGQARGRSSWAALMEEGTLVAGLRHPNIVPVFGMVVDIPREPIMVMECSEYGSLYEFMRNDTISLDSDQMLTILKARRPPRYMSSHAHPAAGP